MWPIWGFTRKPEIFLKVQTLSPLLCRRQRFQCSLASSTFQLLLSTGFLGVSLVYVQFRNQFRTLEVYEQIGMLPSLCLFSAQDLLPHCMSSLSALTSIATEAVTICLSPRHPMSPGQGEPSEENHIHLVLMKCGPFFQGSNLLYFQPLCGHFPLSSISSF